MLRSTSRRPKGDIDRTFTVKPFEVEKVSRAEAFQIQMLLKLAFFYHGMEEDVEGKVSILKKG